MKFTYTAYRELLQKLICNGFNITDYLDWQTKEKTVILRHDIDNSILRAVKMSEIEYEVCGGGAIYFILFSSNFYNISSAKSRELISQIIKNGGKIGLHFDATQYPIHDYKELITYLKKEARLVREIINYEVKFVSMHRPSKKLLEADLEIPGMINSYAQIYFNKMKYISDSRRNWREDVTKIIESGEYNRLHVLTHPFWYCEEEESGLRHALIRAFQETLSDYYDNLQDNIRDIEQELSKTEIERNFIL